MQHTENTVFQTFPANLPRRRKSAEKAERELQRDDASLRDQIVGCMGGDQEGNNRISDNVY